MAYSCFFKIGENPIETNKVCFASIRNTNSEVLIIIPKRYIYISEELSRKFVEDVIEWFEISYKEEKLDISDEEEDCYVVNVTSLKFSKRILAGMFLRTLWEGYILKEKNSYRKNYDEFYKIPEMYFRMQKYYKAQDKFKLFLAACNLYLLQKPSFNSNHFLTASENLIAKRSLEDVRRHRNTFTINNFFAGNGSPGTKLGNSRKDYWEAYRLFNEQW